MSIQSIKEFVSTGIPKEDSHQGLPYYFDNELVPINYATLIPGHFYTFNSIVSKQEDEIPSLDEVQTGEAKGKKPYFDKRPIFLSLGQEGPMEVGLNMKVMPPKVRKWFVQKYLSFIMPTLEKLVDDDGDFRELADRMRLKQNAQFYQVNRKFIRYISEQIGLNLEFLVDKYRRGDMGNPLAIIDWDAVPQLATCMYHNDKTIISKTPISYFLTKFT